MRRRLSSRCLGMITLLGALGLLAACGSDDARTQMSGADTGSDESAAAGASGSGSSGQVGASAGASSFGAGGGSGASGVPSGAGGSGGGWTGTGGGAGKGNGAAGKSSGASGASGAAGASTGGTGGAGGSAASAAGSAGAPATAGNGGAAGAPDACAGLDKESAITLYQSSDDSNSMASPAMVRKMILAGNKYVGGYVRPYEFLNYYRVSYAPANPGHVRVVPQLRAGEKEGELRLQIGIQAPAPQVRRPMNLAFVLDTSGSMGGGGRIDRERAAMKAILSQLQSGDIVSIATWNTSQQVLFDGHVASGPDDPALVAAMAKLVPDGGTNLSSGINKGFAMAQKNYAKERMNRVVMITDGEANVGETDGKVIGAASHTADGEGIYLVGVNVGDPGGDPLMNQVTDLGRGASVFLDTEAEATRMFTERFDETMEVAARAVRLELTIPWYLSLQSFSGEQSSTNPKDVDPQHLAPGDAMVFNQVFSACSPQVIDPSHTIKAKATWETPLTHEARADEVTVSLADLLAEADPAQHRKGTLIFEYALAVRSTNASAAEAKKRLAKVIALAEAADPQGKDAEITEIVMLSKKLDGLL